MDREGYQCNDWCIVTLNDAVEDALSKILKFGFDIDHDTSKLSATKFIKDQILAWAKHIAGDIPGYSNWQEIYDFTFDALYSPDTVPGEDTSPIGTEADLVTQISDPIYLREYALQGKDTEKVHLADHALSLTIACARQEILDLIAAPYSASNPMPRDLALLFRKIRYTYKLRECLLGQVGYYNGSLEFAADMSNDFEYHMYLVQMKLRRPDRLHAFKAPKAMANYATDPTSLLPWNNQFSFSYSFDEFGPQQMPVFGVSFIERKLVEVLRLDKEKKKWRGLCALLSWNPDDAAYASELDRIKTEFVTPEQMANTGLTSAVRHFLAGNLTLSEYGFETLNLPQIMTFLTHNKIGRKAFYTLFLGLTWLDVPLRNEDYFTEKYEIQARKSSRTGAIIDFDLAHLSDDDIKHPRIAAGRAALIPLSHARYYYPQVVGCKANLILTPEAASDDYRRKLLQLSEADLDQLFHNIPDYPHTESQPAKLNAVIKQAVNAARDWQTRAVQNHRPIYTGTSGHMLSYARIFLDSEDPPSGCGKEDHPNLEQLRLTLLAAMIGFNQCHTYDECMTASHGLTHGGVTLEYKDPVGYRDIIDSNDSFTRDQIGKQLLKAMVAIGKEMIANFKEQAIPLDPPLPSWDTLVAKWFKDTTGRDFPAIN